MQKIFTFLLSMLFVSMLSAQKPETTISCTKESPVIGGDIDEVWKEADENAILLPFKNETPTLGSDGDTWWKGLWVPNQGIYLLANVTDDDYYPFYAAPSGSAANMYDQIEWYFDCNYVKEDGIGASPEGNAGHYQIAPAVPKGGDDGTMFEDFQPGSGIQYAYNATDAPNWWQEIFIPFIWLKDKDGIIVDIGADIGFDVTIVDGDRPNDNSRQRAVWANDGNSYGFDESLNNMDGAGLIYLSGGCYLTYPEYINLTGGDITKDNEPFQIGIEIFPEETTDKTLKWIIHPESTAKAKLSQDGLVTPVSNGVLIVSATSSDGYILSNDGEPIVINISGQYTTVQEVNYIIDGRNDNPQENGRPNAAWIKGSTGSGYGSHAAYVEDGVFVFNPDSVLANQWDMKVRQRVSTSRLAENKDEKFLIGFKMWASEETTFQLVLEQDGSRAYWGNNSASQTTNAVPVAGQTRWDITPTTEPALFKMSFVADNLDGNGTDFCFQPGKIGNVNVYMDSLYLIEAEDSSIILWDEWEIGYDVHDLQLETLNVYPNPAKDKLNVSLSKGNTNVTIYNSLGVKMEEIRVEGTHQEFNISNYSSGMYFVKANNTVVKFVK